MGTGFLISDDLVLTCYHVVKPYMAKSDHRFLSVCFDSYNDHKELKVGVIVKWDIPFSEPSVGDQVGSDDLPDVSQLDFAILRLDSSVGRERGSFSLNETRQLPQVGDPILIAGHPGPTAPLQRLKFSMAAPGYVGVNANETRLIYKTSTLKGSSGSPVFDRKFRLIGLHHNRGEEGAKFYQNNRGIPISKIIDFLSESKWADTREISKLLKENDFP